MTNADWLNAVGTILIPIILAFWGFVQWRSDRNLQARQQREEASRNEQHQRDQAQREARQRDEHLTRWGMDVISLMAELEGHCGPLAKQTSATSQIASLAWRASALVDQGRLFFPNVETRFVPAGYRPKLLDEVIRAAYIARTLASGRGAHDLELLRKHTYSARRRFIILFQKKVEKTLYPADNQDVGISISPNPYEWDQSDASWRQPTA